MKTKRFFYLTIMIVTLCFAGCTDQNAPGNGVLSTEVADYVGTWNFGDAVDYYNHRFLCLQLNSDLTCKFVIEKTEADNVLQTPQGAILGYESGSRDQWTLTYVKRSELNVDEIELHFGRKAVNASRGSSLWYTLHVTNVGKDKIRILVRAANENKDRTVYLTRTSDSTIENYFNNLLSY